MPGSCFQPRIHWHTLNLGTLPGLFNNPVRWCGRASVRSIQLFVCPTLLVVRQLSCNEAPLHRNAAVAVQSSQQREPRNRVLHRSRGHLAAALPPGKRRLLLRSYHVGAYHGPPSVHPQVCLVATPQPHNSAPLSRVLSRQLAFEISLRPVAPGTNALCSSATQSWCEATGCTCIQPSIACRRSPCIQPSIACRRSPCQG